MYWSTPAEELTRMNKISVKRSKEWQSEDLETRGQFSAVIPSQFFAVMSIQTAQALHVLINEYAADFENIAGVYVQRLTEMDSGPEILINLGFVFGGVKYVITPIAYEERLHRECGAVLLGTHKEGETLKDERSEQLLS
tara:strand:+ start:2029 stop:2445 length:417 start_codon:yes stop_codon:yes gene_type:complete